jgi:hypothetical protein
MHLLAVTAWEIEKQNEEAVSTVNNEDLLPSLPSFHARSGATTQGIT